MSINLCNIIFKPKKSKNKRPCIYKIIKLQFLVVKFVKKSTLIHLSMGVKNYKIKFKLSKIMKIFKLKKI